MRWRVKGAASSTGVDIDTTIDADDEAGVKAWAKRSGVLISAAEPLNGGDGKFASAPLPETYPDIGTGAAVLRAYATFLMFVGGLAAFAGIAAIVISLAQRNPEISVVGVIAAAAAVPCFVGSAIVKMLAALALAIRDIAKNSFSKE